MSTQSRHPPSSRSLFRDEGRLAEHIALLRDLLVAYLELERQLLGVRRILSPVSRFHLKVTISQEPYLVDIRLGACSRGNNALDETRHLRHDVYPVEPVLKLALDHGLGRLAILGCPLPVEADLGGFGPVIDVVALGLNVLDLSQRAGKDDLAILGDATHSDRGRSI